jgi:hypothetical protein
MVNALAFVVCAVFLFLALWHFRMAFMRPTGETGAVPSVDGKPLFVPSTQATLLVGIVLTSFAGLVAATAGFVDVGLPAVVLAWLSYGLALGLLARAVGDFRYVGFSKRVRGTPFARLDTWIYSPLCLLLAIGVASVALGSHP